MAIANSNPDTSDGYRDIFVIEPTTPYKVGDIWFKEDGSIYRCNVARASGDFNDAEWIPSSEYSNDNYENDAKAIINDFKQTITTNYICKVLVKSTRDSIELSVESITGDYTGTLATLNSRITQINNSIMLEVNKKINATDITGAYLVLKINGDSSSGKLSADKIDITANNILKLLAGNAINLTSRNIVINSDNFNVSADGTVRATNGTFSGEIISTNATITGGSIKLIAENLGNSIQIGKDTGIHVIINAAGLAGYSGDTRKFYLSTLGALTIDDGFVSCPTLNAKNILHGHCTLNSSSTTSVDFGTNSFTAVPAVVITPKTSSSGVIAPKLRSVSTSGFTAIIGGTGFSNIDCDWIAISQ